MTSTLDRHLLRSLVMQWQRGEITERDVHERAEHLWDQRDWPDYPTSDARSIAIEVLAQLDILNHQLITVEDVPAIVDFLNTPPGSEEDAWEQWQRYWDNVDLDKRKQALRGHPSYNA